MWGIFKRNKIIHLGRVFRDWPRLRNVPGFPAEDDNADVDLNLVSKARRVVRANSLKVITPERIEHTGSVEQLA
jgi:hypothetical protein